MEYPQFFTGICSFQKRQFDLGDPVVKTCTTKKSTLPFQVQMLTEQVGHLAESQATTDDRYSKVCKENSTLTQK